MYFKISELHSWGKRAGQVRRHNCAVLPHVQRKFFLRFGGLSDRLNTDWTVFSETRRAVELLQQFSGLFCSCLAITIPVPALRPCLMHTAFASPWYARPFLL